MPRPKKNRASASVYIRGGGQLTDKARAKILYVLGFENAGKLLGATPGYQILRRGLGEPRLLQKETASAPGDGFLKVASILRDIEATLSLFSAESHLDHMPRAADYIQAFRPVHQTSKRLLKQISEWSDFFRSQFEYRGVNLEDIEQHLRSLADVASSVETEFKPHQSKGRGKQTTLAMVISNLRQIFWRNYCGPRPGRSVKGSFTSLGEDEKNEREFVALVLAAAHRRLPPATLGRLFRDPRCAVPQGNTTRTAESPEKKKNI